jgi:hypothetical protein
MAMRPLRGGADRPDHREPAKGRSGCAGVLDLITAGQPREAARPGTFGARHGDQIAEEDLRRERLVRPGAQRAPFHVAGDAARLSAR